MKQKYKKTSNVEKLRDTSSHLIQKVSIVIISKYIKNTNFKFYIANNSSSKIKLNIIINY